VPPAGCTERISASMRHERTVDDAEPVRPVEPIAGEQGYFRPSHEGLNTIDSVTQRLKAPKGSFYYRFTSRDALLGEVWLATVLDYQEGFVGAIDAGDGLAAALHTPAWTRQHLDEARLLLLYRRHDFVQGDWPAELKRGVRNQAQRLKHCFVRFSRQAFGSADSEQLRRTQFVLVDVPIAAVKMHLERREPPPRVVDELITKAYHAVVGNGPRR
jgi:AcrR family transcriptional regulator